MVNIAKLWREFSKSRTAIAGLIIIIAFSIVALAAPIIAPYNPKAKVGDKFTPPNSKYLLGTDNMGRDVFSWIIYGTRISLLVGILAALLGTIIGTVVGLVSGYYGGLLDVLLMRVSDVFLTIPFIPLAMLFAMYFGPNIWNVIFLLGFMTWPGAARQIRSQVLYLREAVFIEAARAIGADSKRIIFSHLLPNVVGVIVANIVTRVVGAILAEAGLSFVGVSDPTNVSWGLLINYGMRSAALYYGAWWTLVPPGACIALLSVSFSLLGNGIFHVVNPRLKAQT
ncbi:MAG: ABC transporter permease [Candidatus Bathyarchaeia archaeon]